MLKGIEKYRFMKIKKNVFWFYLITVTLICCSFIFSFFLPEKFFFDAKLIVNDPHNEGGFIGSYPLTMSFYKYTGLGFLPFSIVGLIQLPILFYLLKKIGIPGNFHIVNIKNILVYLSLFMMSIFIAMPSKEFITFIFIFFIVHVFLNEKTSLNKKILNVIIAFVVFGILYRPYYAFIPILVAVMALIANVNLKNKVFSTLFFGIVVMILMSLSYGVLKGKHFSQLTREEHNLERALINANTMILSPVDTSTWYGEVVGVTYGFFSVNFPINGLKHFLKPQVIMFIIWQFFLIYILLIRFSSLLKNRKKYTEEYWLILILFSYFIIQGVFETDLGTAVRHKIGVFPLIYFILYYEDFRKKIHTNI